MGVPFDVGAFAPLGPECAAAYLNTPHQGAYFLAVLVNTDYSGDMDLSDGQYAPVILTGSERWSLETASRRWYTIVHVYEGMHRVRIGSDQWQQVPPGGVYLITPLQVAELHRGPGTREVVINFTVRASQLLRESRQARHLPDDEPAQPQPKEVWGLSLPTLLDDSLWSYAGTQLRWMSAIWWRDNIRHFHANMLLAELLTRVVLHYEAQEPREREAEEPERPAEEPERPAWLARALKASGRRLAHIHSVADLATIAGYSTDHFRKLFQQYHGETAAAFLRRRRREAAAALLVRENLRPGEIAEMVGYRSVEAMDHVWQKYYGTSPGRWRRDMRSNKP